MSLHIFNSNNKSWNIYTNTLSSISGDDLTIKPYDGQNIRLEVSGNNSIFIKKGDLSYNLSSLIGSGAGTGSGTSIASGSDASFSNIDVSGNLNPLNANGSSLGSSAKIWGNAYIRDVSISNVDVSGSLNPLITNNSSLGISTKIWGNAYIRDVSITNLDVSGNLNPLNANGSSLGSSTKIWGNAYIRDISTTNVDVSGNIIPSTSATTATGGTITTSGAYNIHSFTTVGTTQFTVSAPVTIEYLVIAGGGAGGLGGGGGGGGAGGVLSGTTTLSAGSYTITVGAGGPSVFNDNQGSDGGSSSIGTLIVTTGGGGGGSWNIPNGRNGGSGGGQNARNGGTSGGTGITGQGFAGASYTTVNSSCGGGGAGASASGSTGGIGITSTLTGTTKYYAGGGGGGGSAYYATEKGVAFGGTYAVANGTYGGGNGGYINGSSPPYTDAVANTGGGGGGQEGATGPSGAGGSGIVVIRYISSTSVNGSSLGFITRMWRNAYIRDISVSSIDVSGNLNPLNANNSSLGASTKYWGNAYIRDVTVSSIGVSGNILPLITNNSNLGSSQNVWKNVSINDISLNKINGTTYTAGGGSSSYVITSITSNIVPSTTNTYNLGSTTKYWNNSYIKNLKVSNRAYQEISGDVSWSAVNGFYGLAKDAYPALDAFSSLKTVNTWKTRTPADTTARLNCICWSPELGLFVTVALTGIRIGISTDGINWTAIAAPNGQVTTWQCVCWSPQLRIFVAVSSGGSTNDRVMISSNGSSWTIISQGVEVNSWNSVCWSPELGLFVAVATTGATNRVMTSTNGTSWTARPAASLNSWRSVCWSPELGIFVAVSDIGSNQVMTSPNGISWTSRVAGNENNSAAGAPYACSWLSVCWSPELGMFAAGGNTTVNSFVGPLYRLMSSPDGINWTPRLSPQATTYDMLCWSPQLMLFTFITAGGMQVSSADGINWGGYTPFSINWRSICWSPELGIMVAAAWGRAIMTSSLKGRPPTSYNVFDNTYNRIDETGKWTFSDILTQQLMVNTTSYSSDDRVKHNEVIINNGLAIIDQLTPKFYQKTLTMLDASYNSDLRGYAWTYEAGLIAQEVLQVPDLSFAVSGGDYYEYVMNYDLSNNDLSNNDLSNNDLSNNDLSKNLMKQVYGLNYNSIFVYGLAAIKELHAKVKAQEISIMNRQIIINSLTSRIEALDPSNPSN